jgi:hypothetical protein
MQPFNIPTPFEAGNCIPRQGMPINRTQFEAGNCIHRAPPNLAWYVYTTTDCEAIACRNHGNKSNTAGGSLPTPFPSS